jgi:hypothetical protein
MKNDHPVYEDDIAQPDEDGVHYHDESLEPTWFDRALFAWGVATFIVGVLAEAFILFSYLFT